MVRSVFSLSAMNGYYLQIFGMAHQTGTALATRARMD
jgi:hypothetical protein